MRQGLATCVRVKEIHETRGEFRAIEMGLRRLRSGDLILVQADQVEPSLAFIQEFIAKNSAAAHAANEASNGSASAGSNGNHSANGTGMASNRSGSTTSTTAASESTTALVGK